MSITLGSSSFGVTAAGREVLLHTLRNTHGVEVAISDYGGVIQSLRVADRDGHFEDVVLGYDSLAEYEQCTAYLGCITGRYANRIAGSGFRLDGVGYLLENNFGEHHLHSASAGFNSEVWDAFTAVNETEALLSLKYLSADGHGGYPGALSVEVSYRLNDQSELRIDYAATTDKPTIVNLTNHSYFNLAGHQYAHTDAILNHEIQLHASRFIPTDNEGIPLGYEAEVANTPFDFQIAKCIGKQIIAPHAQLAAGGGFDHTWVIDGSLATLRQTALVRDPVSGRSMAVSTTQPGVQFYTANNLVPLTGKGGQRYGRRGAFCLETQHFANSPNEPSFPTTVLRPGQEFHHSTVFRFAAE